MSRLTLNNPTSRPQCVLTVPHDHHYSINQLALPFTVPDELNVTYISRYIFAALRCYAQYIHTHRRFGKTYRSHLQVSNSPLTASLEDRTDRLSRNVGT